MSTRNQSRSNKPNVDAVADARIKLYKQEIKDVGKELMVSGMKLRSPHGKFVLLILKASTGDSFLIFFKSV